VKTCLWIVGLVALTGPAASRASAQVVEVPAAEVLTARPAEAPKLAKPAMTLAEAVALTIRHNPQIGQSSQALRSAIGRRQETKGLFDFTVLASPSLTVTLQQLTPFLVGREAAKRLSIQIIADEFTALTEGLRAVISKTTTAPPACPPGVTFSGNSLVLDFVDPKQLAILGLSKPIRSVVNINLEQDIATLDFSDICSAQTATLLPGEAFVKVWRQIDQSGGLGLNGILTSVSQIPNEARSLEAQIAQDVEAKAKLALDRLGPVPTDDLQRNFTFDVNVSKRLRTGFTLSADFQVQSQEHNFVDKPLDPTFGGLETPPEFYATGSVTLNVPLLRGRGSTETAAPERVAEHLLAGQREQLRHDVSEDVFQTVVSYLNLVAAQDTLTLIQESAARQQRLLDLTQRLVTIGDVAQVELGRIRARQASVASGVSQARAAVLAARLALARTIGVDLDSLDVAPLATEMFGTPLATLPDTTALIQQALAARRDLKALDESSQAAVALAAGARAGARDRIDFTLTGGYSNLYDSPFFKFLPDDGQKIITTDPLALPISSLAGTSASPGSPVRFYQPQGFYRALTGRYTPYVTAMFTLQLPFGNNGANGRSAQAQATLTSSTIERVDLRRVIGERVVGLAEKLRRTSAAIDRYQSAIASDDQILTSELQRFQTGEATLIDTLLTEEESTSDKLQLVRERQAYFSALARLKLETGDLVAFDQVGTTGELIRFLSASFVAR
jgi:outer membrane protein TolC